MFLILLPQGGDDQNTFVYVWELRKQNLFLFKSSDKNRLIKYYKAFYFLYMI